ncbi:MAG: putative outer membrane protein [Myxococcaceae bacterium]|nr:putative outer membrane protein [Myxococcaceae bacterium]
MKSRVFKAAVASVFMLSLTGWAQDDAPRQDPPSKQSDPQKSEPELKPRDDARGEAGKAEEQKKLSRRDKEFVIDAAIGGLAEVELGKLAQEQGQSQDVKDLGERLLKEHEKANRELEAAVAPYDVMLPTRMDSEHQRDYDKLKAMKGADFDNAFARHIVKDHEKTIKLFKKQAKSGEAKELKEYATRTIPVLEEHLKIARDLAKAKAKTTSL